MHWRRKWQPTPVFLPGESQGRGSLVGCRLWGRTKSDTTEATYQQQLCRFQISLVVQTVKHPPAIRDTWVQSLGWEDPLKGMDLPLQYSGLENPRDRGAWWATDHGIAKSWTRLSDFHFSSLGPEDSPGGNGHPLQSSGLQNPMDRGYSP